MGSFFNVVREDKVLITTLAKPKQHNVLNPQEMGELQAHFEEVAKDTSIRVGVITGEGKSFCAGADLGELKDYDFGANPLENLTNAIEKLPFPTICKLNGGVYGGGTDLAFACDFRIGKQDMKCFIPPAKIGIHYHPIGLARAVSRIGLGPAKRLFLALETMTGEELKAIGFLDYLVVDDQALEEKVAVLTDQMSGLAPLSLRGMKATLNDIAAAAFDDEKARQAQIVCLESSDFEEGRKALAEKRPPRFTGA